MKHLDSLPYSPLTTNTLRVRLDEAQLEAANRAASVAERVDRSQQPANRYDVAHMLAAGREFAALDRAVTIRFAGRPVAA